MTSSSSSTFEQTMANIKTKQSCPDPIHWKSNLSYRSSPYRLLHHQTGTIGTFTIQLVQGKNLIRNHWSLFSMGPFTHLGLSKAHGEITSFVQFQLCFIPTCATTNTTRNTSNCDVQHDLFQRIMEQQQQGRRRQGQEGQQQAIYQSSTIHSNSNPIWSNIQSSTNKSLFTIPLLKKSQYNDDDNEKDGGMNILLQIVVKEESTPVDTLLSIPGITKGSNTMNTSTIDGTTIGIGYVDITNLLLKRDSYSSTCTSLTPTIHGNDDNTDIWDVWMDLILPNYNNQQQEDLLQKSSSSTTWKKKSTFTSTGQVRIIISYKPHGLVPKQGDVVALESFARFHKSNLSSWNPIIPPYDPCKVVDIKGDYLLLQFDFFPPEEQKIQDDTKQNKSITGRVKVHRNTIFVIERTNVVDTLIHTAFIPMDIALATPLGKSILHHSQPIVHTVSELSMPLVLSTKLFWEACKLGSGATFMGVQTAASVILSKVNSRS